MHSSYEEIDDFIWVCEHITHPSFIDQLINVTFLGNCLIACGFVEAYRVTSFCHYFVTYPLVFPPEHFLIFLFIYLYVFIHTSVC